MLSTSIRLLADAASTDVYLISCCLFQADRTSTLLSRSAEEEQQPASGRRFKEDKTETCINFGLDLDLPHPDTYRPETGSNPLIVFVLVIATTMAIIVCPFPGRCYTPTVANNQSRKTCRPDWSSSSVTLIRDCAITSSRLLVDCRCADCR